MTLTNHKAIMHLIHCEQTQLRIDDVRLDQKQTELDECEGPVGASSGHAWQRTRNPSLGRRRRHPASERRHALAHAYAAGSTDCLALCLGFRLAPASTNSLNGL